MIQLEELPLQNDKMREALTVIAEIRNSDRLRQYLATGIDRECTISCHLFSSLLTRLAIQAGDIVVPTRPDLPRGLNQLGNTCYLNSLLQVCKTSSYCTRIFSEHHVI